MDAHSPDRAASVPWRDAAAAADPLGSQRLCPRDRLGHRIVPGAAADAGSGRAAWRGRPERYSLGPADRARARLFRRRLRPVLRRPDPGHWPVDHHLRPLVSRPRGPGRALLRLSPAVPGRHAGHSTLGQRPGAPRLLGADQSHLLPADRLLAPATRGPPGCTDGADRHGQRWPVPDRRHATSGRGCRHLPAQRAPDPWRPDPQFAALPADLVPGPGRRLHQVGAVPLPLLAAARHGCPHAGLRLPAFGDHGEGRHLPAWPPLAGARGHRCLVPDRDQHWTGHHGDCRLDRLLQGRPQSAARLLDCQPSRPDHRAVRHGHADCRRGRGVPHPQPLHLQGGPVPVGGHRRPRGRDSRREPSGRPAAPDADHRHAGDDRRGLHGRPAAAQWVPVEGDDARVGGANRLPRLTLGGATAGDPGCATVGGVLVPVRDGRVFGPSAGRLSAPSARPAGRHVAASGRTRGAGGADRRRPALGRARRRSRRPGGHRRCSA